jgi:hypothetical protein
MEVGRKCSMLIPQRCWMLISFSAVFGVDGDIDSRALMSA